MYCLESLASKDYKYGLKIKICWLNNEIFKTKDLEIYWWVAVLGKSVLIQFYIEKPHYKDWIWYQ